MENSINYKLLPSLALRHLRGTSNTSINRSISHRRFDSIGRIASQEKYIKLINQCESHVLDTKQLREQIHVRDKRISLDFKNLNKKIQENLRFYDENYIANEIKLFRNEKKAFIYQKGRYISGLTSRIIL